MLKNKSVCVFCSSSNDVSHDFDVVAKALGEEIARRNCRLVYGGSSMGLMRTCADAVLDNGGDVLGVMPEFMQELEWSYSRLKPEQFLWTSSMATRKDTLFEQSDVIIVLPGAVGTLEEVSEALSLKRLGRLFSPIVFINTNDFYKPLVEWLNLTIKENLMREQYGDMWYVAKNIEEAMVYLDNASECSVDAVTFAAR